MVNEAKVNSITSSPTITPVDPYQDSVSIASPLRLMWWKFREHRLAMVSGVVLIIMYLIALFAPFIATYDPDSRNLAVQLAPPSRIYFGNEDGSFSLRAYVHNYKQSIDRKTFQITYTEDTSKQYTIRFLARGEPYSFFGLFQSDLHLIGVDDGGKLHLFGTDALGRDLFSRTLYASRVSLTIGLVGVLLSLLFGIILGGLAGFYGGWIDNAIQRLAEIVRAFPDVPLWMTLSAALPLNWSPLQTYFFITIILSVTGWTSLARVVRGRILSLRNEDFVYAAQFSGARTRRVILRHLIPSMSSHIIATVTLAIPGMILGETALSFLGLGIRPPALSWGVLLNQAQNIYTVMLSPWLMIPGIFIIVVVLAFNFFGDGLRDAADPYSTLKQ
jgi:peptide/nickel transport system permease protein